MRAAWLICSKDLRSRVRDRSVFLVGVVVPLALAFIFNAVFSGAAAGAGVISLGIATADNGTTARHLVSEIADAIGTGGFIAVHREPDQTTARTLVSRGKLDAAIIIPAGFSAAVQANGATSLHVVGNADEPISSQVARSVAEGFAADINRVRVSVATTLGSSPPTPVAVRALIAKAQSAGTPVSVEDVSTKSKQLNPKSFYAAGMAVFFVFFTVQFGITGLLEERVNGTLARLVAAPIRRSSILFAKLLTSLLLGLVSMAVLVVSTSLLFGASWGDPVGVAVLVVTAVLAATGVMSLVATAAKTADQASNWQSVVAAVLGLLGGTFFPVSQAPGVLSKLTFVAPQAWFLRGLGDLRAGSLHVIWVPALAMVGFAAVTGGMTALRMSKLAES